MTLTTKCLPSIISLTLIFLLLTVASCKKKQVDAVIEEPIEKTQEQEKPKAPIDSAGVIEKLTADGRVWCLERITRTIKNKTVDVSEDTLTFTKEQIWYAHANIYSFYKGGTIKELPQTAVISQPDLEKFEYADGLSGNRPYGAAEVDITFGFILFNVYDGVWNWSDKKQTFSVNFPEENLVIFWKNKIGYLDSSMFPQYRNLDEAKSAGKPERIRIIMEAEDGNGGKVVYGYTLRAAWIVEKTGGYYRTNTKYSVIY